MTTIGGGHSNDEWNYWRLLHLVFEHPAIDSDKYTTRQWSTMTTNTKVQPSLLVMTMTTGSRHGCDQRLVVICCITQ